MLTGADAEISKGVGLRIEKRGVPGIVAKLSKQSAITSWREAYKNQ